MKQDSVTGLLALACPKPCHIASGGGGAVLALALHCLMVRDGFTPLGVPPERCHSTYTPPPGWNGAYKDEWVFHYTKDGFANTFTLHCSLQLKSGKMFVHASEENNLHNIQVMGFQLENYVADPLLLKRNDWDVEGIVTNQQSMVAMFMKYITTPLIDCAEELPLTPSRSGSGGVPMPRTSLSAPRSPTARAPSSSSRGSPPREVVGPALLSSRSQRRASVQSPQGPDAPPSLDQLLARMREYEVYWIPAAVAVTAASLVGLYYLQRRAK